MNIFAGGVFLILMAMIALVSVFLSRWLLRKFPFLSWWIVVLCAPLAIALLFAVPALIDFAVTSDSCGDGVHRHRCGMLGVETIWLVSATIYAIGLIASVITRYRMRTCD